MLFNKAIIVLAIFSVKRGIATEIREEQRLRSTSINAKDSEVKKYATNANSILPMEQEPIILKDDSEPKAKTATQAKVKSMATVSLSSATGSKTAKRASVTPSTVVPAVVPAKAECMPGDDCGGGVSCPYCFVEPCHCPEVIVEAAVF